MNHYTAASASAGVMTEKYIALPLPFPCWFYFCYAMSLLQRDNRRILRFEPSENFVPLGFLGETPDILRIYANNHSVLEG